MNPICLHFARSEIVQRLGNPRRSADHSMRDYESAQRKEKERERDGAM